jgi:ferric-dicitrate binding protein FerR (iron transport regulator)
MSINAAHWHALVNHIPIIGVPMVAILLVWGIAKANEAMVRLALLATVVMAGAAWLADNTGGKAEHEVKDAKLAWVSRHLIHEHEEVAEKAELAAIVTGVLALGVLVMARGGRPPIRPATYGVLLGLGVTAALLAVTAWKGGDIRHDEFGISTGNARLETPSETEHEH